MQIYSIQAEQVIGDGTKPCADINAQQIGTTQKCINRNAWHEGTCWYVLTLSLEDDIDANTRSIVHITENDPDGDESLGSSNLDTETLDFHQNPKRKRTPSTIKLLPNKKTRSNAVPPPVDSVTLSTTLENAIASVAAVRVITTK